VRNQETPDPTRAPQATPTPSRPGPARRFRISSLVWSVYAPSFLLTLATGFLLPTLPRFASSLGAGIGLVGLVIAAVAIGAMAADVPAGIFVQRVGRKPAMIVAVSGIALAAVAGGLSPNLPTLLATRLLHGAFHAVWGVSRHAYLADVVPNRQRGRALSLFGGLSRTGSFISPVVGGYIGQYAGLRWPFFAEAAIATVTVGLILVAVRETGDGLAFRIQRPAYAGILSTLTRHRRDFATAGLFAVCLGFIRTARQTLIPLVGEAIGLPVGDVGLILTVSSGVDMTLFIPAGYVMDRLGRKWANLPCVLFMSAGVALIPLATGFAPLMFASAVLGFGDGLGAGAMLTLGADLAPEDDTAQFLGVWHLISDSGRAIGPAVIGQIGQAASLGAAGLATAGIGLAGAAVLVLLVPETLAGRRRVRRA